MRAKNKPPPPPAEPTTITLTERNLESIRRLTPLIQRARTALSQLGHPMFQTATEYDDFGYYCGPVHAQVNHLEVVLQQMLMDLEAATTTKQMRSQNLEAGQL